MDTEIGLVSQELRLFENLKRHYDTKVQQLHDMEALSMFRREKPRSVFIFDGVEYKQHLEQASAAKSIMLLDRDDQFMAATLAGARIALRRDVTENELLAAIEICLNELTQESIKDQLIDSTIHDLNNVLSIATMSIDVLGEKHRTEPETLTYLDKLHLSNEKVKGTVARLNEFVRRRDSHPEPLDLMQVIEEMEPLLNSQMDFGAKLVCNLKSARLNADQIQLKRLIFQLVITVRDSVNGLTEMSLSSFSENGQACLCICTRHKSGEGSQGIDFKYINTLLLHLSGEMKESSKASQRQIMIALPESV